MDAARLKIGDIRLAVLFVERAVDAAEYATLERAARLAGFDEEIAAVWADEFGRTGFFARPERHAFLQAVDYDQLRAQISGRIAPAGNAA